MYGVRTLMNFYKINYMETIKDIIQTYKGHLSNDAFNDEIYKWELVSSNEQHPDLEADNLEAEVKVIHFGNLIYGPQQTAMRNLAKYCPSKYREALRRLYDDSTDLQQRVTDFISTCKSLWESIADKFEKKTSAMCDERLVACLLTFRNPMKYTFYHMGAYDYLRTLTGEAKRKPRHKLVHFYEMLDKYVMPLVEQDTELINTVNAILEEKGLPVSNLLLAQTILWVAFDNGNKERPKRSQKVWLYAPGEQARKWEFCTQHDVMCLGWDDLGNYEQFTSQEEVVERMQEVYGKEDGRFTNDSLAVWNFLSEIQEGDIVIAKDGVSKIIGHGVVKSRYRYDEKLIEYKSLRTVEWLHIGEWKAPGQSVQKTLTDITSYKEYVQNLLALFENKSVPTDIQTTVSQGRVWWLVASPKMYTFADKPVGTKERWTLYNDNGHKRRIYTDFNAAAAGDIVICYDANPTKQIVALAEVSKASDGESIEIRKTETLLYPIDWNDIKANPDLAEMKFVKNPMGMVFCSITDDEADTILDMIREKNAKKQDEAKEYTKNDFLSEVFMDSKEYEHLRNLLLIKKNVILQGAPGVGKTFAAKRLAYSIIGKEDDTFVEMVQFHQNYSYEDFIMGYKPTEDGGFALRNGIFYEFCKRAEKQKDKSHFFIIDEINRGNLSKIFGELLMLIEKDYRGEKHKIKLAYNGEDFSVPENVYIIGMMNTADRSLAMIDYALRRRFSFYSMRSGFSSEGFGVLEKQIGSETFSSLIKGITTLNEVIKKDDSLGEGFCIGHSYFCIDPTDYSDEWLRSVVEYDIAPMLREYWFDNSCSLN